MLSAHAASRRKDLVRANEILIAVRPIPPPEAEYSDHRKPGGALVQYRQSDIITRCLGFRLREPFAIIFQLVKKIFQSIR